MDESKELDKLRLLYGAMQALDEEAPDFYGNLKEAAWNILHENPGIGCQEWVTELLNQYPAEVVDALGNNPNDVFSELTDWWNSMNYEDDDTGECHTFKKWADYFATDCSVELYDLLADARRKR